MVCCLRLWWTDALGGSSGTDGVGGEGDDDAWVIQPFLRLMRSPDEDHLYFTVPRQNTHNRTDLIASTSPPPQNVMPWCGSVIESARKQRWLSEHTRPPAPSSSPSERPLARVSAGGRDKTVCRFACQDGIHPIGILPAGVHVFPCTITPALKG